MKASRQTVTINERLERLITLIDRALADDSSPPSIMNQARARRIFLDPDVQAARRWAREMGPAARRLR
jgi:hypothetical protein